MLLVIRNILFLFAIALVFSCKKTFAPANPAFFVTCNDASVTTTYSLQGYGSDNITDLWLYTNGQFRGAYPVGSKMPVMIENNQSIIQVYAGIKNNGISQTRINWILYEPITLDTLAASGANFVRNFAFKYRSSVKFPWVETFEGAGTTLIKSLISDTTYKMHVSDGNVFEGTKSIELGLSGSALTAQIETASSYSLPLGSGDVYLELDYKGDTEFRVGTSTSGIYYEAIVITPKSDWHHIYIQLSQSINMDKTSDLKKVVIKIVRNTDASEQKIYLDNLKLVYI
jgi:hypothetical protein